MTAIKELFQASFDFALSLDEEHLVYNISSQGNFNILPRMFYWYGRLDLKSFEGILDSVMTKMVFNAKNGWDSKYKEGGELFSAYIILCNLKHIRMNFEDRQLLTNHLEKSLKKNKKDIDNFLGNGRCDFLLNGSIFDSNFSEKSLFPSVPSFDIMKYYFFFIERETSPEDFINSFMKHVDKEIYNDLKNEYFFDFINILAPELKYLKELLGVSYG